MRDLSDSSSPKKGETKLMCPECPVFCVSERGLSESQRSRLSYRDPKGKKNNEKNNIC
jgi:hypothetical protein